MEENEKVQSRRATGKMEKDAPKPVLQIPVPKEQDPETVSILGMGFLIGLDVFVNEKDVNRLLTAGGDNKDAETAFFQTVQDLFKGSIFQVNRIDVMRKPGE